MVKRIFSFLAAVVILAFMAYAAKLLYDGHQAKAADDRAFAEANAAAAPLDIRRQQLQQELDKLKNNPPAEAGKLGTIQFVFLSLDESFINEVQPVMQEYNIPGVLVLSANELPGGWMKISEGQYQLLLNQGWSSAVLYNASPEFPKNIFTTLSQRGIAAPDTVYFNSGDYSITLDEKLTDIHYVIHHGEDTMPILVTSYDEPGIVHLGARVWNTTNIRPDIEAMIEKDGNYVFTVAPRGEDAFKDTAFRSLLDFMTTYTGTAASPEDFVPSLAICSPEAARRLHTERAEQAIIQQQEWEASVQSVQEEIDTLSASIDAIYDAWRSRGA